MSVTQQMYDFLIEPLRVMDRREGNGFLARWLQGPQENWVRLDSLIYSVPEIWSLLDCPDRLLEYLKWIVGWTSSLNDITRPLTSDELRRLISISVRMWKLRGPETSIIEVLFFITSARSRVWNWFDFRWVLGEVSLGEERDERGDPWLIPLPDTGGYGPDAYRPAYISNLRIVDDGTLNRTLVVNLMGLMRAVGERWEITYLSFLDLFSYPTDSTQWDISAGGTVTVENNYMTFGSVGGYGEVINYRDLNLYQGACSARAKIESALVSDSYFGIVLVDSGDIERYVTVFYADQEDEPSYIELYRFYDGGFDLIASVILTDFPLYRDVYYTYRVTFVDEVDGRVRIKVFIDGNEFIEAIDDQFETPLLPGSGPVWSEENIAGWTDYEWYLFSIGGDTSPVLLAATDTGEVFRGVMSSGVISWEEVYPRGPTYSGYWWAFAISYDGQIIIAQDGSGSGYPSVSYDGGDSWSDETWASGDWVWAIGGDNLTIFRAEYGGDAYVSDDLGDTWNIVYPGILWTAFDWTAVAVGRDPDVMAAVVYDGRAYFTTDGWSSVIELRPMGDRDLEYSGVSIAGDDQTILLSVYGGPIFCSFDQGDTWHIVNIRNEDVTQGALGADGKLAIFGIYNGRVFRTDDISVARLFRFIPVGVGGWGGLPIYGQESLFAYYTSIAVSWGGEMIVACAYNNYPAYSFDGGYTFYEDFAQGNSDVFRIAIGEDPDYWLRAADPGYLSYSDNAGSTWNNLTVDGHTTGNWRACAVGSSGDIAVATLAGVGAYMTIDGWASSFALTPPDLETEYSGVAIAADDQTVVICSDWSERLFITYNRGTDWSEITLPAGVTPVSVAISQDGATLWLGTYYKLYRTTLPAVSWEEVLPGGSHVDVEYSGIAVSDSEGLSLCCTSGYGAYSYPYLVWPEDAYCWYEVNNPFEGG